VVVNPGDIDDLIREVLAARPERESVFDTIGALFARRAMQVKSDREAILVRLRLISGVPDLQARR
jgi:hypothetical protein